MIKDGEITAGEVKRIVRRYWWLLPLTIVGCGVLGLLTATVLPKRYTSETLVLVDQPRVPVDYVKPVVTEDLNQRLASMQSQILSRARLQPIIEKFGLYGPDRGHALIEDLVERLRKSVTVKPLESMRGTDSRGLPGFYVDVTFDNPYIAQQICTEITSMFMEQNTREREQQAAQTTSFLSQQLDESKRKLDDQDAKLAQFKRQYLGSLPEEAQTNLTLLAGTNSQLEANIQALSRAQQDKAFNESLLSQQEANWKMSQEGQNPVTLDQQLSLLQDRLTALQAHFTAEHPDIIRVKRDIEELKKRKVEAPNTNSTSNVGGRPAASEPASIQELRAKLHEGESRIADLSKQQVQIQDQIHTLQAHVQASPVVEQQFKELTRNYQTALDFYNDLLKKREQSAMATDLEHRQESEQFRVLDAPSLPQQPSFPKRTYFAGGGLGAGLMLGLGLMYLIALSDKSMHTERDVELCLKLPVLAIVPMLEIAARTSSGARSIGPQAGKDS